MITARRDMQKPAISILEDIDILMGNLPQKIIEVFPGFWCRFILVDRISAERLRASGAFLVDIYLSDRGSVENLYRIVCVHILYHIKPIKTFLAARIYFTPPGR